MNIKITQKNRPFVFTFYFILLSFVLPFLAVVICMLNPSARRTVYFSTSLYVVYIASWPSFLLKIYPYIIINGEKVWDFGNGLIHPLVILVNALGWGLVGFIVGLIISAVKGRRGRG